MMKYYKEKYEALGFVEALIAIMVVGLSSVVLMQIAVDTMQNVIQNEVIDKMTQHAVESAEVVQRIADLEKDSGANLFPNEQIRENICFQLNKDQGSSEYTFGKVGENFIEYNLLDRNIYKEDAVIQEDDEFFRIVCLETPSQSSATFVVAKIIIGQVNSEGEITKGNNVQDYEYLTTINL